MRSSSSSRFTCECTLQLTCACLPAPRGERGGGPEPSIDLPFIGVRNGYVDWAFSLSFAVGVTVTPTVWGRPPGVHRAQLADVRWCPLCFCQGFRVAGAYAHRGTSMKESALSALPNDCPPS